MNSGAKGWLTSAVPTAAEPPQAPEPGGSRPRQARHWLLSLHPCCQVAGGWNEACCSPCSPTARQPCSPEPPPAPPCLAMSSAVCPRVVEQHKIAALHEVAGCRRPDASC